MHFSYKPLVNSVIFDDLFTGLNEDAILRKALAQYFIQD